MGRDKFTLLAIALVISVWLAVGLYIWRNVPSETDSARKRLAGIEEALKTQKRMVDLSLMYEAALAEQETSFDATHRVEKLQQYREMLNPIRGE